MTSKTPPGVISVVKLIRTEHSRDRTCPSITRRRHRPGGRAGRDRSRPNLSINHSCRVQIAELASGSIPNGNLSQTLSGKRTEFLRHTCEAVLCTCSSLMVQYHLSVKSLHDVKHRKRQVPSGFCLGPRDLAVADRFSLGTSPVEYRDHQRRTLLHPEANGDHRDHLGFWCRSTPRRRHRPGRGTRDKSRSNLSFNHSVSASTRTCDKGMFQLNRRALNGENLRSDCHTGHLGCERAHTMLQIQQNPKKKRTSSETRPTKKRPQKH